VHVGHARVELLIQEIIELTRGGRALLHCEAKVCSSSVSVVYVVRLRIFSKAALQKRGSIEPIEPPLDPPLTRA